jgi:3-phosphoshikimate 1-carboxyvinyltransferase
VEEDARPVRVEGVVRPPGDKSITHRVLLLSALLRAPVVLAHALTSADARSSARVLRQLGVAISPLATRRRVRVTGGPWHAPKSVLNCGNSGTTARLMLGALAAHPFPARLTGDASLRRRPMRRVTDPLTRMGARVEEHGGDGLPLTIHGGALNGIQFESPVASAQVKSAVLLAALTGRVTVTVTEPARSRDHMERLLRFLGLPIDVTGTTVRLEGQGFRPSDVPPLDLEVPGDPSSSAFLVAAALLAEGGELKLERVGVNPTRTGYLRVLARMDAAVHREAVGEVAGEPMADLVVGPADLRGTDVSAEDIPSLIDEIPVLAVLASRSHGETRFRSVGELRVKESDRLSLLAANLRAVGARAEVQGDDLVVEGRRNPPRGRVETAGDHRIAMAFAVLGTVPGAAVALSERRSVQISYPSFFADLERIGAR